MTKYNIAYGKDTCQKSYLKPHVIFPLWLLEFNHTKTGSDPVSSPPFLAPHTDGRTQARAEQPTDGG